MKSLGVTHSHSMAVKSADNEDTKSYPSVTIDHKAMPHLKKHKVGDTGHMKVKYKVTGQQSYRNGESHTNLDLTHAQHEKSEESLDKESKADEAKENKGEKK